MADSKKPSDVKITSIEFKNKGKLKVVWNAGSIENSCTRDLPQHPDMRKAVTETITFLSEYYEGSINTENLSIKGVKIGHYENKEGQSVQIKVVHTHPKSGQNTTMTTAKMQVHEEHYGFETNLKKTINKLMEEAYQFAVNMKSAQMKVA